MSITLFGWTVSVKREGMRPDPKAWAFLEQGMALAELLEASEALLEEIKRPNYYQLEETVAAVEASIAFAKSKEGMTP